MADLFEVIMKPNSVRSRRIFDVPTLLGSLTILQCQIWRPFVFLKAFLEPHPQSFSKCNFIFFIARVFNLTTNYSTKKNNSKSLLQIKSVTLALLFKYYQVIYNLILLCHFPCIFFFIPVYVNCLTASTEITPKTMK